MFQIKEKDKAPEERLSEVKMSNLPNEKFKVMLIKLIKNAEKLGRRMNEHSEKFNKELENIKNQTELKKTLTEIKNTLEGINHRLDNTEEQSREPEDRVVES